MSDSHETIVNPSATRGGAGALAAAGDTLAGRWTTLSSTINSLNSAKPWGTDQAGEEFNKNYLAGDEPPATLTLDAGKKLVERMQQLGPDIAGAVDGTVDVDDMVDGWFGKGDK